MEDNIIDTSLAIITGVFIAFVLVAIIAVILEVPKKEDKDCNCISCEVQNEVNNTK